MPRPDNAPPELQVNDNIVWSLASWRWLSPRGKVIEVHPKYVVVERTDRNCHVEMVHLGRIISVSRESYSWTKSNFW